MHIFGPLIILLPLLVLIIVTIIFNIFTTTRKEILPILLMDYTFSLVKYDINNRIWKSPWSENGLCRTAC
jgi:hypothetical protein